MVEKKDSFYFLDLVLIWVFLFLLNYFTPLFCDDWHYNFIYGTHEQIKTIQDVFYSQYRHYFNMNGRFVPHFFVQLFDGILGKSLFNIVNSFIFVLFLFLLSYTVSKDSKSFLSTTTLFFFAFFFLIPGFNNCFLWLSGSCNYLWVAVLLLIFNALHDKNVNVSHFMYPILFVFGVICGWTNEALALGLGIGYFCFYVFHPKELSASRSSLLFGYFVGLFFLVFSPGSIHRAIDVEGIRLTAYDTIHNMISSILSMTDIRCFPLLVVALIVSFLKDKERTKDFIKANVVFLIAIIVSFVFVLWTRHDSGQSRFGFELFSLVLLVRLILRKKLSHLTIIISNFSIVVVSIITLFYSHNNYIDYKNCLRQIEMGNSSMILTNSVKCPSFIERYLVHYTWSEKMYVHSPYDKWISEHFNREDLFFIPESLYKQIIKNREDFSSFDFSTPYPFYVKNEDSNIKNVKMILNKADKKDVPFLIRPFANKFQRYTINELNVTRFAVVPISGANYILVNKNPLVDKRLKDIIIEHN